VAGSRHVSIDPWCVRRGARATEAERDSMNRNGTCGRVATTTIPYVEEAIGAYSYLASVVVSWSPTGYGNRLSALCSCGARRREEIPRGFPFFPAQDGGMTRTPCFCVCSFSPPVNYYRFILHMGNASGCL
jgi:hypothetical protein